MMQTSSHTSTPFGVGGSLDDAELSNFFGGVKEGGCVPDPMKDFWEKYGNPRTVTVAQ